MLDEYGLQNQFIANKANGRLHIEQEDAYRYYIENTPEGLFTITIDRITRVRTEQQNKYYWGVVIKFMRFYTGYTSKECHEILVKECLRPTITFINGVVVEAPTSTTGITTHEFFEFVESSRLWVMYNFGVNIPLPPQKTRRRRR